MSEKQATETQDTEQRKIEAFYRILKASARTIAIQSGKVELFNEINSTTILPDGSLETMEVGNMKVTIENFCKQYGIKIEELAEVKQKLNITT